MPKNKDNKRQRIIDAAIKIFAKKGFYNGKVAEIARAAGVADGTIYLYFKNKDDLLISLFEDRVTWFVEYCTEEISSIADPVARLRRLIQIHLDLIGADPDLAQVITVELRQSSKFMREYTPRPFLRYLGLYTETLFEAQKQGMVRTDVTPWIVARALFGAIDEIGLAWVMSENRPYRLAQAAEEICAVFFSGLLVQEADGPARGKNAPAVSGRAV